MAYHRCAIIRRLEETELRIRVMTWKEKWLNKDLPELGKDRKIETSIEGS